MSNYLNYLKQKWAVIFGKIRKIKKVNKKKLTIYLFLMVGIIFCFAVLFIFQAEVNKTAAGDLRLAISYYQQAREMEDKKEKLDKFQKAKLLCQSIISKFWVRDKKMPLFYLGNCLYSLKEYEEASEVLQKFHKKYGNDYFAPWAKIKLAASYEQIKKYEEAIDVYKKVLEEHPQSSVCPQVLLGVARCQELQGKWSEARKSYEELSSRYPLSEEKSIAEVMIQRLEVKRKL